MNTTRRQLFMVAGGSAVGVLFTPAPWRLITDTALWSESWPGIPRPARGEIRAKFTNCPLCPAGCAVRARCVVEQPVALAGVAGHPLSHGALCPFGLTGHHLPYHPARLKQGPVGQSTAAVADAIARCSADERVAVLDLRPGRTASWTYRRAMAAIRNGVYVAPRRAIGGDTAVNLANARTVLSFGAPMLEGWGTPGNVIAAREGFRLIQVEAVESHTAALADEWLRIKPGTEEALAQGIASVLKPGLGLTAGAAAELTGIPEQQIVAVARELAEHGPALVLSGTESEHILQLNVLLGSLGSTIVARTETPVPAAWQKAAPVTDLDSLADGSVRVLMIDESAPGEYLPWNLIEKKLVRDNPVVVAFAWSKEGYGRHAQFTLPTAVYPEVTDDIPPAVDSPAASFRLATPLVAPPAGVVKPAEFVAGAAGLTVNDPLRERADAIHAAGRGNLFTYADGKSMAVKDVKADDFWKALNAGGCWIDAVNEKAMAPKLASKAAPAKKPVFEHDLPLVAVLYEGLGSAAPGSPLLSKLYQESNLRLGPDGVALHPDAARACGVKHGDRATLQTALGKCTVEVAIDVNVPPGLIRVAARPVVLDMCAAGTRAKVVRA